MKELWKIFAWIAGCAVVLVLLTALGLRLFLPADKLKDLALAQAARTLGREVTVQDVRLAWGGGLGVQLAGVRVGNPAGFPAGNFLTAEKVDLKLKLLPLLSRRLYTDRLVIQRPVISLVVAATGGTGGGDDAVTNNFTFAAAGSASASGPSGASGAAPATTSAASLALERCEVTDGTITYQDRTRGTDIALTGWTLAWDIAPGANGSLALTGETAADSLLVKAPQPLSVGPVQLTQTARIEPGTKQVRVDPADLTIGGLGVALTGEGAFGATEGRLRADLHAENWDLQALAALLPPARKTALRGAAVMGRLDGDMHLDWVKDRPRPLDISGSLRLSGGRIEGGDLAAPVKELAAEVAFDDVAIRVTRLTAQVSGAQVSFTGAVTGWPQVKEEAEGEVAAAPADSVSAARLEGTVSFTADLQGLQPYLPPARKSELRGTAAGTLRLAGNLDRPGDLFAGGNLTVTDAAYRDQEIFEPITDLDLTAELGPLDLTIRRCEVTLRPSRFSLTGSVRDAVPALLHARGPGRKGGGGSGAAPVPQLAFTLTSPRFNADHLFPAASPGVTARRVQDGTVRTRLLKEFPLMTGGGTVRIDTLVYSGVNFLGVKGMVAVADRVVTVSEATGTAFAGQVSGQTAVDLRSLDQPRYRGTFAARGIQADSLLGRFTPLRGYLQGALDFGGDYAGVGTDPAAFRRSLTLDASAAMTQGRLVTTGVIQVGLNSLAGRLGRTFDKEEKLKDLAGMVKISGEKVILDGLTGEIPGLGALTLSGGYGFGGNLDLRGDLLLTPENSRKLMGAGGFAGGLAGLLKGKSAGTGDRRFTLPIRIGGTWSRPEFAVDTAALAEQAKTDLSQEARRQLEGLLKSPE